MAIYRLKRKTYSDENGMSTGKKIALGTLGTAATAGLGFAAAKRGMLGNNAMLKANRTWGNLGSTLSRNGVKGVGENMMLSGAQGMGKAKGNILAERLGNKGVDSATIQARRQVAETRVGNNQLNKFLAKA